MKFSLRTLLLIVTLLSLVFGSIPYYLKNKESIEIGYHVGYLSDPNLKYYFWSKRDVLYLSDKPIKDDSIVDKYYTVDGGIRNYYRCRGYAGQWLGAGAWHTSDKQSRVLNRTAMVVGNGVNYIVLVFLLLLLLHAIISISQIVWFIICLFRWELQERKQQREFMRWIRQRDANETY